MGIFDSKTKSKSEVIPYDPGQLQGMLSRLEGLGRTPMQFFPGQTYADLTPLQEESLGMQEAFARDLGGGMVDPAMAAWESTIGAPDVANNPYVQGLLEQQAGLLNRNFAENLLPSIRSGAIASGNLGGTRQGVAEGIAARGTQEALAREAARTQMGAYTAGLGQQRYGLSAAPGMAQFGMRPAGILGDIGGVRQGMEQRGINEAMARHQFAQDEPWMRLERQAGLFNPLTLPYAAQRGETTQKASDLNKLTQIAGLATGLGGMIGGGFGDLFRGPATTPATMGTIPMPDPQPATMPGMIPMTGMGAMNPQMGGYWPMQRPY